jgi:hypothetical protein
MSLRWQERVIPTHTAAASGVKTDSGAFQRPPMVGGDGDDTQQLWIMTLNKAASRHIEI